MKQLRDKETGKIVSVTEVKDGWVYYRNGQTRLDHLYEFFEEIGDERFMDSNKSSNG